MLKLKVFGEGPDEGAKISELVELRQGLEDKMVEVMQAVGDTNPAVGSPGARLKEQTKKYQQAMDEYLKSISYSPPENTREPWGWWEVGPRFSCNEFISESTDKSLSLEEQQEILENFHSLEWDEKYLELGLARAYNEEKSFKFFDLANIFKSYFTLCDTATMAEHESLKNLEKQLKPWAREWNLSYSENANRMYRKG